MYEKVTETLKHDQPEVLQLLSTNFTKLVLKRHEWWCLLRTSQAFLKNEKSSTSSKMTIMNVFRFLGTHT